MKKTFDFGVEDENIISSNSKYFKYYVYLPIAVFILISLCGIILAIVFASLLHKSGIDNVGDVFCAYFFGGFLIGAILYILLKIMLSYNILHIYYLKKLVAQKEGIIKEEEEKAEIEKKEVVEEKAEIEKKEKVNEEKIQIEYLESRILELLLQYSNEDGSKVIYCGESRSIKLLAIVNDKKILSDKLSKLEEYGYIICENTREIPIGFINILK